MLYSERRGREEAESRTDMFWAEIGDEAAKLCQAAGAAEEKLSPQQQRQLGTSRAGVRLRSPKNKGEGGGIKRQGAKFFSWFHQRNPTDINGCNWEQSQLSAAQRTHRDTLKTNTTVLGMSEGGQEPGEDSVPRRPHPRPLSSSSTDRKVLARCPQHLPRATSDGLGQGVQRLGLPFPTEQCAPPGMQRVGAGQGADP